MDGSAWMEGMQEPWKEGQFLILHPSPSSLSSPYVIPHQAHCPPLQCPCSAVAA